MKTIEITYSSTWVTDIEVDNNWDNFSEEERETFIQENMPVFNVTAEPSWIETEGFVECYIDTTDLGD